MLLGIGTCKLLSKIEWTGGLHSQGDCWFRQQSWPLVIVIHVAVCTNKKQQFARQLRDAYISKLEIPCTQQLLLLGGGPSNSKATNKYKSSAVHSQVARICRKIQPAGIQRAPGSWFAAEDDAALQRQCAGSLL